MASNVLCLSLDMSRFISALLAKEKSSIKSTLARLELASGENDIDSRLISEIIIASKMKLRQLGLDTEDTTPEELHRSLVNLAELHDGFLAKSLGGTDSTDVADMLPRIAKQTNLVARDKTAWSIKHAVAKRQLKLMPPKILMKKLGYRSIDSMLKREAIDDLYAGIRVAESDEFINKFFNSFKKLRPSDFESRKMAVRLLTHAKWSKASNDYVKRAKNNVVELKELGSVVIMPLPVHKLKGTTIMVLPLVLHKLNEIHLNSSYLKFEQVKHDFGDILCRVLLNNNEDSVSMAGLDLSWGVIRDYFGQLTKTGLSDVFEPHIQTDDLEKNSVEESLYKLEPALHFWFGNDCLGVPYAKGSVSFNLMDIATDYVNNLAYGENSTGYLNGSLWDELLKRYLSQAPLQDQVLQQLDNQSVANEFSEPSISGAAFA
jgi:hypothetical protein